MFGLRDNSYCSACVTNNGSSDPISVSPITNGHQITGHNSAVKILLIGDSGVGKTSMIFRWCDDTFSSTFIATIGIDFRIKTIQLDGQEIKLQIWDTAGQERFHTITKSYYRNASGIILVYDVTQARSFENINKWLRNIDDNASDGVVKMLVGNKCDMVNICCIPREHGESLARQYTIPFYETSAKRNVNIDIIFFEMARLILERRH